VCAAAQQAGETYQQHTKQNNAPSAAYAAWRVLDIPMASASFTAAVPADGLNNSNMMCTTAAHAAFSLWRHRLLVVAAAYQRLS